MKSITQFILESKFDRDNVLKTIQDIAKTYDKKFIKDAIQEIQSDIDEQDEFVEDNPDSNIWQFIQDVADELDMDVFDLWSEMGGSYDFADALSSL